MTGAIGDLRLPLVFNIEASSLFLIFMFLGPAENCVYIPRRKGAMGLCASRTAGILCLYSCTECNMHRVIDLVIGRKMLINVESTLSLGGRGVWKKSTVCTLVIMSTIMNDP